MTDDRIVRETIVRESVFERHAGRAVDQVGEQFARVRSPAVGRAEDVKPLLDADDGPPVEKGRHTVPWPGIPSEPLHQGDVVEFLMRNAGAQLVYQRNLISPASVQMIPVSRQFVDLMALTSPGYEPIATATTTMPGFRR